ncbi:DUF397 domain-containing protein [Streptomyces sp. V3I7]|uniref:DUF397 domain-containing protein n=1 Tax=Streptomyces sp. V3I7 TaxID=3042278 RepID=UPI00278B8D1B|nr:DUF397 domain-containing protein [Streptomyces sp. V3I7]MDQ0991707.1 hypothetical protein [Streptomyces sp. V3I7]
MSEHTWQKASVCGEGDSCVHVASTGTAIHLTESADPTEAILTATPASFRALLSVLNEDTHRG